MGRWMDEKSGLDAGKLELEQWMPELAELSLAWRAMTMTQRKHDRSGPSSTGVGGRCGRFPELSPSPKEPPAFYLNDFIDWELERSRNTLSI